MTDTDTSLIQEELLARIYEKMKRLNSMRPIPADALRRFSTSPTGSENHLSPLRFQTFNRKVF